MDVQIALLRGINVGGNRILPMAELRALLEGLGATDAKTYIQSGNAVYRGTLSADEIAGAIEAAKGFCPRVVVLSLADYEAAVAGNPFPEAVDEPKALHLFFLAEASTVDCAMLDAIKSDVENYVLTDKVFYLHTPEFLTGSKLAAKLESYLGVAATARNWRSVQKVLQLARGL